MRTYKTALSVTLFICVWFSQETLAQSPALIDANRCSDTVVTTVGKHFRLSAFAYPDSGMYPSAENGALIVAGVCRNWPGNDARIIAAFAYDAGIEYEKQLLVVILDRRGNRVIATYNGVIPEDAATRVNSYSLRLDLALYTLSKTTRAFGLRINTFHDRCAYEAGFDDEMTLFVVKGKAIKPVLTETMSQWRYGGGNRCDEEDVDRAEANVSISVEPTSSNGFFDLKLTARPRDKRKPVHAIVKYDGDHYDLQPWKKVFHRWWEAIVLVDPPAVLLSTAISNGDIEQIRLLIARGADLTASKHRNTAPLHQAVAQGKKHIVEFLIDQGADVNGRIRLGDTPLNIAAEHGNKEIVELLLNKGADINATGYLELTPLHKAASGKHIDIVELLLSKGADVHAAGESGLTPLHYAAMGGDKAIMSAMIARGADIRARETTGLTPLHRAAYCGSREAIELLIAHGVEIDAQDKDLLTPLHWAASGNCPEAVELLVKNGADVTATTVRGETPLQLAIKYKKDEAIRILSGKGKTNSSAPNVNQSQNQNINAWCPKNPIGKNP